MARFTITTKSYTAVSSGEGAGIIDSDILYDSLGFPFIPAKRLKGLLKESAIECLEILDIERTDLIDIIFGKESLQGNIHFPNLFIENYSDFKREFELLLDKNDKYKSLLNRQNILSYFTTIRQLTAIDENGIAKEHSLRTIRVIKPDITFEGEIDVNNLGQQEQILLYLAVKNLRKLGQNRNTGFGMVACNIDINYPSDFYEIIKLLKEKNTPAKSSNISTATYQLKNLDDLASYNIKITTLSPVLLSDRTGDLNTTDTRLYIPGTTIRGLFARKLMKQRGLNTDNAHNDELFKLCFIEDKISFGPAYPFFEHNVYLPFPQHLQSLKSNDENIYDIFNNEPEELTRTNTGFAIINENKISTISISTRSYFHGSRDRIKGKNEDGAIFYYDSIEPNNEFIATISGPKELLNLFFNVSKEWIGYIGRSKTSQYGKVKIEILENHNEKNEFDFSNDNEIVLCAISPIILLNEYGEPDLSIENLKKYLQQLNLTYCDIVNSIVRIEKVNFFNHVWGTQSKTYLAIKEGSAFHLKFDNNIDATLNTALQNLVEKGIGEFTHLGYGRIKIYNAFNEELKVEKEKREKNISKTTIQKSKNILLNIIEHEYKKRIEYIGLKEAKEKKPNITPSLCGRMINALQKYTTKDDFKNNFLENEETGIKGKKAYEQLEKADLIDALCKELNNQIENNVELQELNQFFERLRDSLMNIDRNDIINKYYFHYWIAFFKQVRLNQKNEKS